MLRTGLALLIVAVAVTGVAVASGVERDGFSPPQLAPGGRVAPTYPPAAFQVRFEGSVSVAATVDKKGTVSHVEVVDSSRPNLGFEEAAMDAVWRWQFRPAMQDGEPVQSTVVYQLDFRTPSRDRAFVASGMVTSNIGDMLAGRPDGQVSIQDRYVNSGTSLFANLGRTMLGPVTGGPSLLSDNDDRRSRIRVTPLAKATLPPCRVVGCLYDHSKLLPKQIRTKGGNTPTK